MTADTQRRRSAGTRGGRRLSSAVRPSESRTRSIVVPNAASMRATDPAAGSSRPSPRAGLVVRCWRFSQARTAAAAPRCGPKRAWTWRGMRKWRNPAEPGVETRVARRRRPRGSAERSATVMRRLAELASGPVILAPGGIPGAVPTGTMTWPAGGPGRPAEAALAPGGPIRAAPVSMAAATLAV